MNRLLYRWKHGWFYAICLSACGCKQLPDTWSVDRCATIPSGAIPAPAGNHVDAWQRAQIASASADQGVFYRNEFQKDSAELTEFGRTRVWKMAQNNLANAVPVIVEFSGDEQQDAARLETLHREFAKAGIVLAPNELYVAIPAARGLEGFRAQQVMRSSMGNRGGGGNMGNQSMGTGGIGMGGGGMGGNSGSMGRGGIF